LDFFQEGQERRNKALLNLPVSERFSCPGTAVKTSKFPNIQIDTAPRDRLNKINRMLTVTGGIVPLTANTDLTITLYLITRLERKPHNLVQNRKKQALNSKTKQMPIPQKYGAPSNAKIPVDGSYQDMEVHAQFQLNGSQKPIPG